MKIIMSGFTALQINSTNRPIQKIDVPASIVSALRSAGHEVDWRRVTPGEDLSSYDAAWVNLAPLNSLNGRAGAMGALWVLAQDIPTVGFFDDWQFSTVFNGARSLVKRPQTLYKHMLTGAPHRGDEDATYWSAEDANAARDRIIAANPAVEKKVNVERYYFNDTDDVVKANEAALMRAVNSMLGSRWEAGMVPVCPMYAWGDRGLVRKRMPKYIGAIEALDPSSTIYSELAEHTPLPPAEKKREWVLGALMPHDGWVERTRFTWPLNYVGSKKLARVAGGQRFKTESEVLDYYNQHWGILSPPYPHAGSGWWRSRFMYAARVRSVLVADKGEGNPIGPAYKARIADIERMDDNELAVLADEQAAQLRPWMPDPALFQAHVCAIIDRAVRDHKGVPS